MSSVCIQYTSMLAWPNQAHQNIQPHCCQHATAVISLVSNGALWIYRLALSKLNLNEAINLFWPPPHPQSLCVQEKHIFIFLLVTWFTKKKHQSGSFHTWLFMRRYALVFYIWRWVSWVEDRMLIHRFIFPDTHLLNGTYASFLQFHTVITTTLRVRVATRWLIWEIMSWNEIMSLISCCLMVAIK